MVQKIEDDMIFRLSHKRSPGEVKLKSLEWAVVTQLDGEKTVEIIAEILALSEEEKISIFSHLLQEGLLEYVGQRQSKSYVDAALLDDIEYQFTLFMGPVASVIMDEVMDLLGRNRTNLEVHQLSTLVELLALEITSEEKQKAFKKEMVQKILTVIRGAANENV